MFREWKGRQRKDGLKCFIKWDKQKIENVFVSETLCESAGHRWLMQFL